MNIGFAGLGIMGSAMATNLLKAGFNITVWNELYKSALSEGLGDSDFAAVSRVISR